MLIKFLKAAYLLLDFSNYKYYRKTSFLSGYNRVTDINAAVDPTAKICSTSFQRNLTPQYNKTTRVRKIKSGEEGERHKSTKSKGYYMS